MISIRHSFLALALLIFVGGFAFVQAGPSGGGGGGCGSGTETFSCWGSDGNTGTYIAIPLSSISASPNPITQGQGTTVTWACSEAGGEQGYVGAQNNFEPITGGNGGSVTLYPSVTTTYTSICHSNSGGNTSSSVTVTVNAGYPDLEISASTATQASDSLQAAIWSRVMNSGNDSTN